MTQAWTIIDTLTGEVVYPCYKTGSDQHPVDDGFVAGPNHEFFPLDEAPDPAVHEWNGEGWQLSADKLRSPKIARLKELRDRNEFGVVAVPQGSLQIDEQSQGRMARAKEAAKEFEEATGFGWFTYWTMADNSEAPINLEVLKTWTLLIAQHVQFVFSTYKDRRIALEAATSPEELDAVEIEGGWHVAAL